jgi:hypothetical protein
MVKKQKVKERTTDYKLPPLGTLFVETERGADPTLPIINGCDGAGRKRLMMIVLARDWKKSKKQLCALTLGLQARDPTL